MSSIKEALTAHMPTGGSIVQGGSHRAGQGRPCTCGVDIFVFHDELPESEYSTARLLSERFVAHIMEHITVDEELIATAAQVRAGDSNDAEIEALWDVAQAYADLFDTEIPDVEEEP